MPTASQEKLNPNRARNAEQFIAQKLAQWEATRDQPIRTKDIGRAGVLSWYREAVTLRPQSNYASKVFSIERIRLVDETGTRANPDGAQTGNVEYRFGYWTVGKNGRANGRWVWGQYSPQIPAEDLGPLLEQARRQGTILEALD